jgi:hypothetical protein
MISFPLRLGFFVVKKDFAVLLQPGRKRWTITATRKRIPASFNSCFGNMCKNGVDKRHESGAAKMHHQEGEGETLRYETNYFRVFPNPSDVFANHIEQHGEFLLPIAMISLKHLSPDWKGDIPIAMPIEPAAGWGEVGERSEEYHNYLCRANWIGYHLIAGRLQLACDFKFFHKSYYADQLPKDQHAKDEAVELTTHYKETRMEFACRRQYFREHGSLIDSTRPYREGKPIEVDVPWTSEADLPLPLVNALGGKSYETNWAATHFPLSIHPQPRDEESEAVSQFLFDTLSEKLGVEIDMKPGPGLPIALPKTEDGRDFVYVGCFEMGTYLGIEDGGMMVFYDDREKTVLTTFDWT